MPFVIVCAGCQRKLRIPDALIGKTLKCPHCARKMKVPANIKVPSTSVKTKAPTKLTPKTPAKTSSAAPAKKVPAAPTPKPAPAKNPVTTIKTTAAGSPPKSKTVVKPVSAPPPEEIKEGPPPARSKPVPPKPAPPKPTSKRKGDDEEEGSKTRIYVMGGILVVLGLVAAVWYLYPSGGPRLGTVTGTIKLADAPFPQANVTFVGEGPNLGTFQDITAPDGTYRLFGHTAKGIPVGKYKVIVSQQVMPNGKLPEGPIGEQAREAGLLRELVASEFSAPESTTLSADVKDGSNILNFTVQKASP